MSTHEQTRIRSFAPTDLPRVAAFLRQINQVDSRVDGPEDEAFSAFVRLSSNQNGRWFAIAETGDAIVAVLLSGRYRVADRGLPVCAFRVFVAPEYRGRGLGGELLTHLETQHADAEYVFRTVISGDWPAGRGLLERRGFRRSQEMLILRRTALPPEMPPPPHGFRIRDADLQRDGEFIADLYNIANRRSFGFAPVSVDEIEASMGAPGGRLLVLESSDGELAGSVQTLPYFNGVGVLHTIQVAPSYQRSGFGRFLLLTAINALAQQGFRTVELTVDRENTNALRLYDSTDFVDWRRDMTYERTSTT